MITHGCGKSWTGAGKCHCGNCHETFSSVTAFDRHQRGWSPGSPCENPALKGLVPSQHTWGTCWGLPASSVTASRGHRG